MTTKMYYLVFIALYPHPLLAPELNDGYKNLREAYDKLKERIESSDADLILIYSTTWPSIVGHQIQAISRTRMDSC